MLFGGTDGSEALTDTWEYDNGEWTEVASPLSPHAGPMAYDSRRQRVLLSDVTDGGPTNGTWQYRYTSDWPEESCSEAADEDGDGLSDCADPDCEDLPCDGGFCSGGSCQ